MTLYSGVFASLAGSYFQIIQTDVYADVSTTFNGGVGLQYASLASTISPFIAAAGVSCPPR